MIIRTDKSTGAIQKAFLDLEVQFSFENVLSDILPFLPSCEALRPLKNLLALPTATYSIKEGKRKRKYRSRTVLPFQEFHTG